MKKVKRNDRTTLLLDYRWMPIGILTARASFKHFYKNRIVGLDKNKDMYGFDDWQDYAQIFPDHPCITSAKDVWTLPTISIVTERFFRKFQKRSYSFQELCVFYNYTCQICLEKFPRQQLTIEHVEPRSKHGTNFTENKTITCKKCNCKKGSEFPYYDVSGKELRGTIIPNNFLIIEDSIMRDEWKDFIWHK